jgi:hypothetical protein
MIISCSGRKNAQLQSELESIALSRGDITLCGSGADQFGSVDFNAACSEATAPDFNLAMALLHSFEYTEAEKVFAKIIDVDPRCVMAYWGVAMCNFHPLWVPPTSADLEKGSKIIALGRSIIRDRSSRESDFLEAIATIYDQWNSIDHRTRLLKFEKASKDLYEKYPDDDEVAIIYALALDAAADPADKTFQKQKEAGAILNKLFIEKPNHPGIAHYIIHNYDYPELAELGLPAARKYASIAAASAHAQHMPSHIFIRLGLWDESIQSNLNSVDAAKCYAESSKMEGHWDEELHGLDYLLYAYLQKGDDAMALQQINYLSTISEVSPLNFKVAYSFAAMPARFAVERRDWQTASALKLAPADFPWDKFLWEKANIHFARLLGAIHTHQEDEASKELSDLESIHAKLSAANQNYQANLVQIQIKASQAWIKMSEGQKPEAIKLMTEAAEMEERTAKHPVTPGEIVPARELLGDLFFEMGDYVNALKAYEADLAKHPNRFNGVYSAGLAAQKTGDVEKAKQYYNQLLTFADLSDRPQVSVAKSFLRNVN